MVEVVDDNRPSWLRTPVGKVVDAIGVSLLADVLRDVGFETFPVVEAFVAVNLFVQREQLWIFLADVPRDAHHQLAAPVAVFEPDEDGELCLRHVDGLHIECAGAAGG